MMDDDPSQLPDLPPQTAPESNVRSGYRRALLLWLPLLLCAGCLLFVAVQQQRQFASNIPVTGDPLAPPTPTTDETDEPLPPRRLPADPGLSYKEEAVLRLRTCGESFHAFFVLEQFAIHQPELAASAEWQRDAARTMDAFRDDCLPLGAMPFVPNAYQDVDRWMKLAAGEVSPAADGFAVLLDSGGSERQDEVIDHLLRFIEYTRKAQDLIDRLDRRKHL